VQTSLSVIHTNHHPQSQNIQNISMPMPQPHFQSSLYPSHDPNLIPQANSYASAPYFINDFQNPPSYSQLAGNADHQQQSTFNPSYKS
jgi:hypothetical protein